MKMKCGSLFFFFLFICFLGFSQNLHHQTLAAHGSTVETKSGLIVLQSIGQMSPIGNMVTGNVNIQQGFQQSLISQVLAVFNYNKIIPSFFPNPFISNIKVSFSSPIIEDISVTLFNILGVQVYTKSFTAPQTLINLNFGGFTSGTYVLLITGKNYSYSKTIIKL